MTPPGRPSGAPPDRRGAPTLTGANLRLHGGAVLGVVVCLAAGWFELTRARDGRAVAWVYVIEWPMFAVFGLYIWWRLWHEPDRLTAPSAGPGSERAGTAERVPASDPQLAAWEQYLRNLQAVDPPGAPPEHGR